MQDLHPPHPIYASAITKNNIIYITGGGGISKSGIPNSILRYIPLPEGDENAEYVKEGGLELGENSGAPMCLDTFEESIEGVKSDTVVAVGINEHCVLYKATKHGEFLQTGKVQTNTTKQEGWQRCVKFSKDGKLFVTGGTEKIIRIWNYPKMDMAAESHSDAHEDEIISICFAPDNNTFVSLSSDAFCIWSTSTLAVTRKVKRTEIKHKELTSFRDCCFSSDDHAPYFYTIEYVKKGNSYITRWESKNFTKEQSLRIASRPVTTIALSPTGSLIAVGVSDGSVLILLAKNLRTVQRISNAHSFPVTCIAFNFSTLHPFVLSSSPDQKALIHCIDLRKVRNAQGVNSWKPFLLLLGLLFFAWLASIWMNSKDVADFVSRLQAYRMLAQDKIYPKDHIEL